MRVPDVGFIDLKAERPIAMLDAARAGEGSLIGKVAQTPHRRDRGVAQA
jgi:hypothetical protein